MRIIDAVYADPIIIAEAYPPILYRQQSDVIKYSIQPNPKDEYMIRQYIDFINNKPLPQKNHITISANGATQMTAAFYSAVQRIRGRPITIQSSISPPYYQLHEDIAKTVPDCEWLPYGTHRQSLDILVIVSPNNPDGRIQEYPETVDPNTFILLDSIFDRLSFTNQYTVNPWKYSQYDNPQFCEINSFSKTGLAGTRVGYAITNHPLLTTYMTEYLTTYLGTNTWSLYNLKCNLGCKGLLYKLPFYSKICKLFEDRQRKIRSIIPAALIVSEPWFPLVFVKISPDAFRTEGVLVRSGTGFNVSNAYSRINLMISAHDFEQLLQRLPAIIRNA